MNKIISILKNKKKLLLLTLIFGLIVVLSLLRQKKDETPEVITIKPTAIPINYQQTTAYPSNIIPNLNTPVNGYSWVSNELVYSTPDGIFRHDTDHSTREKNDYINWSSNGIAIIKNGDDWKLFDARIFDITQTISITGQGPTLNVNATHYQDHHGNNISVTNLSSDLTLSETVTDNIDRVLWSQDGRFLALVHESSENETYFDIYNTRLEHQKRVNLLNGEVLLDFIDNTYFTANNNILYMHINDQVVKSFALQNYSEIQSNWLNKELLVTEKVADEVGRLVDYVWLIDNKRNKTLFTTSKPVVRRFDLSINLYPDPKRSILPIPENNGTLWIHSLSPGKFPSYTEKGVIYNDIEALNKSH